MAEQTTSSVTIAAPKNDILGVIADFGAYPEWANAVREAEVLETGADGKPVRVRFALDKPPIKDQYVLGYQWGDDSVHWDLVEQGSMLSGLSGAYLLNDAGSGTEVVYKLAVDVKIPMIGMFKRKAEKVIIDTALKDLKRRVEG